jgi:hypothetical protein
MRISDVVPLWNSFDVFLLMILGVPGYTAQQYPSILDEGYTTMTK